MKVAAIVNPASGGGRTLRVWRQVSDRLIRHFGALTLHFTEKQHHATELAKEVATQDFDRLIVVGGDGTLHEVVNGLFDRDKPLFKKGFQVGIINGGRGCDFVKSVGLDKEPNDLLRASVGVHSRLIDVGRVQLDDRVVYYLNSSTFGLGGEVARSVQSGNTLLPPTAMYFSAVVKKVLSAKAQKIKVELDGHVIYDGPAHNAFFCNGKYSGGGMLWAPKGKLDDGLLDVILIRDLSRTQLLTLAPRLFTGTLSSVPGISLYTAKEAKLTAQKKLWLELDGEAYQTQSVGYSVLDKALSLLVLK